MIEPTQERRERGAGLMKETLTPHGAPIVARYKARVPFTLLDMRQQIMEDASDKPKAKRERSLRRRLTPFDRALSEEQAEIIDKLVRGALALAGKLRCGSWQETVDGSKEPGLPFSAREQSILALYGEARARLAPQHRAILADLCARMMPDPTPANPVDYSWIAAAKAMADAAISIFNAKHGK